MIQRAESNEELDVIVIGGGPAGSTCSTLIAQQGFRVRLFEREKFPRFHIGESLIPETYWVLERLNMLPKMKASKFVHKHSVQFVTAGGRTSAPFYFYDNKPHECSQTWQVLRSEFDLMMLRNAAEHGVQVHEGHRVLEVLFEGDRAVGVEVIDESGTQRRVYAPVVVDASGQASMIMSRLGLREWDPVLKKAALWTYWQGAYRDTGRDEGATIVMQIEGKNGWFWYIPLHRNITSVGVVAPFEYLFDGRGDHERGRHRREQVGGDRQAAGEMGLHGVAPSLAAAANLAFTPLRKKMLLPPFVISRPLARISPPSSVTSTAELEDSVLSSILTWAFSIRAV